jgi:hypothetical protein
MATAGQLSLGKHQEGGSGNSILEECQGQLVSDFSLNH